MTVHVSPFTSLPMVLILCLLQVAPSMCFLGRTTIPRKKTMRYASPEDSFSQSPTPKRGESDPLHAALKIRQDQLKKGIGKRYIVRTQQGFLNVHSESTNPFALDNIVGQLAEGDVVTSIDAYEGDWVCHDKGGWSIASFRNFTWLEPIDE
mmetsp:Transcript_3817/g.5738  ORF Transcript_3817/g.5738 Transcript_3817/m.5738 type:complete len:151 (-) Transcript_3817:160-612(-)|eukprot:CAMPEP_0197234070 /NCGR_PEP_ID=MMETSP1429-20130617/1919_1 /TAXON_ID=49237 /ORGANISM="Chaetoceros  sp., Strain UNC1202" /LENGTH=150 /DNA_ID=CAMNT_0042692397 /DNA_START=15 /DNA_END=467 /DNA_ORIENTATION=-